MPTNTAFGKWVDRSEVHRNTYRILCVIAGILSPAFGIIYQYINPDALDPLWLRITLSGFAFLLLGLSFVSGWAKRHFISLVHFLFYVLTLSFVGITALNNLTPNYTIGMLFTITAIGIAFSLGLKRIRPLTRYLSFTVLITLPAILQLSDPAVSPSIIIMSIFSIALVIYLVARSKIQAEEAMKASEQRYHRLMNAANDAILIANPETGLLVDGNQKAQELTGYSESELRQLKLLELYPPSHRERYDKLFKQHVFAGAPIQGGLHVQNKQGAQIPVDISASLIDVGDKQLIQGIFRDATARHRYEEQLIQAKERAEEMLRLKTSFLNNMSHEIRTPLTSILGYAEILGEEIDTSQQEFAHTITKSARRLQKTLNSVLDLARLESGEATLEPANLNVAEEVEDAVSLLHPLADQKNLFLKFKSKAQNVFAQLDPTCLNRIVNNLVSNAIKFTEEGSITVIVDADSEHVYLRVKDTGIGISDAFLNHLFDEFRQESTGLSRSHEGSGLGLAITKRLIDLMQGTIKVDSKKGVGSVFTVTFPRALKNNGALSPGKPGEHPEEEPATPDLPALSEKKILVVEDNPDTKDLVKHILGSFYQVETTTEPETALQHVKQASFDTLILDINLGTAQDGIDLLREMRAIPGYQNTPAIALTAYTMPGDRERFLEAGFDQYLGKPFTKQDLLDHIKHPASALQTSS